jgi:hypothetical protein
VDTGIDNVLLVVSVALGYHGIKMLTKFSVP